MGYSLMVPKCANKYFRKIRLALFCGNKKPKAKVAPPPPPAAPPPSPPAAPPSQPREEDVHAEEHQPCMGGDCDCIVDLIDQMWKIPGMRSSISVTNWGNWGDHMDVHCYYDRYIPPNLGMPLPVLPSQRPGHMAPFLPAPPHGMFPPPPEHRYGLAEPPLAYHHDAYDYPYGPPPHGY